MNETAHTATRQWPGNIVSGSIHYGKANNYDGFYLADDDHGIPTFGSVCSAVPSTIRGQHVRVFNYPGQTEAIAAELVKRWNAHDDMLAALTRLVESASPLLPLGDPNSPFAKACEFARAAISKATARLKGYEDGQLAEN